MRTENKQLKAFLEDAKLIATKELERAYDEATANERSLGEVLLEKKLINESQLIELQAYIAGVPFIDLTKVKIDRAILHVIPEPIARKNNIIAYNKVGTRLEVAMLNPRDLQTIDFIRKTTGLIIQPRFATKESIQIALKQYEQTLEKEFETLIGKETSQLTVEARGENGEDLKAEDLEKEAQELPIIRIVDSILRHAISQRASDIHIEPEERDVLVRYRIDGILHDAMTLPKQVQTGIVARIKVLSNLRLDEHRLPQDGRFTIKTPDYKVSFRVSMLPVFDGEKIALRLLVEDSKGYTLEELGWAGENLERITQAIRKPLGMILASGPTGSGKTTTLYTLLEMLNKPGVNISTIEDPIEYRMPRINQTQVKPEIGLSFANGLRSLVRQDPDIVMVGEIRDSETANLAINAALTGHLVLSTLHTNSAAGALPRLVDMGQEPFLIASTVNAIIGQRLVRRLCNANREKYHLNTKEITTLSRTIDMDRMLSILKQEKVVAKTATWSTVDFFRAKPSDECPDGYRDRVGIHEVLEISEAIRRMIMINATATEIAEQAKKEGMITMFEDGIVKATQGITTIEEILRVTSE